MIKLGSFTLFLSWKCNFACDHCGFSCGPTRKEKMALADAYSYIEQALTLNPELEMIAFSGGEPFLYLEEIKELMAYSAQKGLVGGIVSNCYWAVDYPTTLAILSELKALGLQEIITSFDDYHIKYVPPQNIKHVLKAAGALGLHTGVNILATQKSRIRRANIAAYLDLPLDDPDFLSTNQLWIKESSPLLTGRAAKHFRADELLYHEGKLLLNNPCPYIIRNSVVTPEGALYACCGFGDASEHSPASIAYVGNLQKQEPQELFRQLAGNLMFNLIHLFGPYLLIKLAQESDPSLQVQDHYVSNCEVCAEITGNAQLRTVISKLLQKLSLDALLQPGETGEPKEDGEAGEAGEAEKTGGAQA